MEIAGFKWDPDKKRYFKILKTGQLPDQRYTISGVASENREEQRKRADEFADSTEREKLPSNVFQYKRLGKSVRTVYSGASEEILSTVHVLESGKLATGSRNGILSLGGYKSDEGRRSILGIAQVSGTILAIGVDDNYGSLLATGNTTFRLPKRFATSHAVLDDSLMVGTQKGVTICNFSSGKQSSLPVGSISAVTNFANNPETVVLGGKSGSLSLLDLRTSKVELQARTTSGGLITHLAETCNARSVLVSALKDELLLFDLRQSSQAALQFSKYKNWSTTKHGFSMNSDKSAVSVVTEDSKVGVWDAVTGAFIGPVTTGSRARIIPPSISWQDQELFIANMNNVNVVSRRSVHQQQYTDEDAQLVEQIHKLINA